MDLVAILISARAGSPSIDLIDNREFELVVYRHNWGEDQPHPFFATVPSSLTCATDDLIHATSFC